MTARELFDFLSRLDRSQDLQEVDLVIEFAKDDGSVVAVVPAWVDFQVTSGQSFPDNDMQYPWKELVFKAHADPYWKLKRLVAIRERDTADVERTAASLAEVM